MDNTDAAATTAVDSAESLPAPEHEAPGEPSDSIHRRSPETDANAGEKRKRDDDESEVDESSTLHPLYKTSLCSHYRRRRLGVCSHGDNCRFAHAESELRRRPDGSWDPTSERAKKMMKMESGEREEVEREEGEDAEKSIMMTEVLGENDPKLSKCLVHLPLKWSSDQLRNFLTEENVVFKYAKKKKGMAVGFVSFETAEQVKSATEVLHGKSVGNKNLKVGDVVPRSCDDKIKSAKNEQLASKAGAGDRVDVSSSPYDIENSDKIDAAGARAKSARDAVTPLAHMPYAKQLEHKKNALMQTLKRLTRNARKACPNGVPLPEWIFKSREIGGLPCKLEGIIESPIINGYRNKCEFSVGYSVEGKPTVGFMLGNFREGISAVQEPVDCPNISKIACKYASIFRGFLQDSTLPIWNRFNNTGFWRQLTVREGRNPAETTTVDAEINISEVMLMVQVCSSGVDAALIDDEFRKITQAFSAGAASSSPPLPLTALLVQDHTGISNVAPADAPLRQLPISADQSDSVTNEGRIRDYISNLKFSISPTAFFQVNTLAAEKLYSLAGDWAGLGPDTLLFDICCGTGTIGLTLAHRVGTVVGIEMNASAVSDAQRNAEINGIKNCRFVCSKAEDVMGSLLREYLHVLQKQDENSNISEGDDKESTKTNGKSPSADKDVAEGDDKMPSETCSSEAAESDNASCHVEHCGQEPQNQPTKTPHVAEDGSLEKKQFENVVAIVDPPRMGLHPVVIKALRTHPRLRRLVYISCNPETLVANAIELCTPSSDKAEKGNRRGLGWRNMSNAGLARQRAKSMPNSEPFRPVKAMAVDLFPHTPHCELVMLLER